MMIKATVQCPCCDIMVRAYYQCSAESLLCPNCQSEISTDRATNTHLLALAAADKVSIRATLWEACLRAFHMLHRERHVRTS